MYSVLISLSLIACSQVSAASASFPEMMLVLDGSGSMWGKIDDKTKIEAAQEVITEIIPSLPSEVKIGLAAYGHNRKGDCGDIEIILPPGSSDRQKLLSEVMGISPKGKTPIADSLHQVTDLLKGNEAETTIVLVSDGVETCDPDPCGAVRAMKQSGINFALHVVGFAVNKQQDEQLACLATEGGGEYFTAADGSALLAALKQVQEAVTRKVETAKTSTVKAATALGKLQIAIPEQGLVSLNGLKLKRVSDGKVVKTVEKLQADSLHPLLKGEYELIAGFANSNYKPDSEVSFGTWEVKGGETTSIELGVMVVNIADTLQEVPAGAVIIRNVEKPDFLLTIPANDNPYYFYRPKPLPPGTYSFAVHYKYDYKYKTPVTELVLADQVQIIANKAATITLDSGLRLQKPPSIEAAGFRLSNPDGEWGPLEILPAHNGDYPLWHPYIVPPGNYSLDLLIDGMDEPLPVAESLTIEAGELLEFDTGL